MHKMGLSPTSNAVQRFRNLSVTRSLLLVKLATFEEGDFFHWNDHKRNEHVSAARDGLGIGWVCFVFHQLLIPSCSNFRKITIRQQVTAFLEHSFRVDKWWSYAHTIYHLERNTLVKFETMPSVTGQNRRCQYCGDVRRWRHCPVELNWILTLSSNWWSSSKRACMPITFTWVNGPVVRNKIERKWKQKRTE